MEAVVGLHYHGGEEHPLRAFDLLVLVFVSFCKAPASLETWEVLSIWGWVKRGRIWALPTIIENVWFWQYCVTWLSVCSWGFRCFVYNHGSVRFLWRVSIILHLLTASVVFPCRNRLLHVISVSGRVYVGSDQSPFVRTQCVGLLCPTFSTRALHVLMSRRITSITGGRLAVVGDQYSMACYLHVGRYMVFQIYVYQAYSVIHLVTVSVCPHLPCNSGCHHMCLKRCEWHCLVLPGEGSLYVCYAWTCQPFRHCHA